MLNFFKHFNVQHSSFCVDIDLETFFFLAVVYDQQHFKNQMPLTNKSKQAGSTISYTLLFQDPWKSIGISVIFT